MQGIEFHYSQVPGLLDGSQTVLHRLIDTMPADTHTFQHADGRRWAALDKAKVFLRQLRAPYVVSELLFLREEWALSGGKVHYRADDPGADLPWASPWMMPVNASRAQLCVVGVTPERIQQVDPRDCLLENAWRPPKEPPLPPACGPVEKGECVDSDYLRNQFARAWDQRCAGRPGASWDDDPWTWRIAFTVNHHKEEDHAKRP